jgi:hypothetical protein
MFLNIIFIQLLNLDLYLGCLDLMFKKLCVSMEFYAAMKKNEMLSFAGKWMELENIILSEVSLAQKTKNHIFSLICRH